MTGYTVHTGSTEAFSEGFDRIFGTGGGKGAKPAAKKAVNAKKAVKKTPAATGAQKKSKGAKQTKAQKKTNKPKK